MKVDGPIFPGMSIDNESGLHDPNSGVGEAPEGMKQFCDHLDARNLEIE